nr:MAG TPA: hypothetical protein [Caudoviricetes sp.]
MSLQYIRKVMLELLEEMHGNGLLPETEIQVLVENDSLVDWYYSDDIERKLSERDKESWRQYQAEKDKLIKTTVGEAVWNCEWIILGKPTLKSLAEELKLTAKDISRMFLVDSDIIEESFREDKPLVHYLERMIIKELLVLCDRK